MTRLNQITISTCTYKCTLRSDWGREDFIGASRTSSWSLWVGESGASTFTAPILSYNNHNINTQISQVVVKDLSNDRSASGHHSYFFWASYDLPAASCSLKTFIKHFEPSLLCFFISHTIIVWAWYILSGHTWTTELVHYRPETSFLNLSQPCLKSTVILLIFVTY